MPEETMEELITVKSAMPGQPPSVSPVSPVPPATPPPPPPPPSKPAPQGPLELPPGHQPFFPEDNIPTTGEKLGVTLSNNNENNVHQANANLLAAVAAGKPAEPTPPPAQSPPLPSVESLFKPPPSGNTGSLQVTDSGNTAPAGATFPTQQGQAFTPASPQQAAPPVASAPAQAAPLHAAPSGDDHEDAGDDDGDDFTADCISGDDDMASPISPPPQSTLGNAHYQIAQQANQEALQSVVKQADNATAAALTAAATQRFAGDEVIDAVEGLTKWIAGEVRRMRTDTGIGLLSDRNDMPQGSYIHTCIHRVRWEPDKLLSIGPHELLQMEAALTAHQVYVQSEENRWRAEFNTLGREVERVIIAKRDNYNGTKTKAEAENRLIETEPRVRDMRNRYLLAQAMSTHLESMGERFAQFEDGIKRAITLTIEEYRRTQFNAGQR